jgi:hypothetical protein
MGKVGRKKALRQTAEGPRLHHGALFIDSGQSNLFSEFRNSRGVSFLGLFR